MAAPSSRGSRAPLTRRRILSAALGLIDERGLDELTMRALGAELGVEAMSIYKHVPGKGAVLDGVVELLLEDLEDGLSAGEHWTENLTVFARRLRRLSRMHPGAFPLLRRRSASAYIAGRAMVEMGMRTMLDGGFSQADATRGMRTIVRHTLGFALSDPGVSVAAGEETLASPAALHREFPLVSGLLEDMADGDGEDGLFEFGLAAVIRGLEPYAAR